MRFADIARAVLESALATTARPVTVTVQRRRLDLLVRDHRVVVEVVRGVLRIVWVGAQVGDGPATRDRRIVLDDASNALVREIVETAVEDGLTPF